MDQDRKRYCRKCLLQDFAPEEYVEHMRTYLSGLNEDVKTQEEQYRDRLSNCERCDSLTEGICKICGCFVEYRAALKDRNCPALHPKW
ncbi:MAG TPA: DUF6171 family protein [Mobilitalea sp.]|nr:DUF6171 family protein [Mobilitalea sp.]